MNDINQKIEEYVKKKRKKSLIIYSISIPLIIIFVTWFYLPPMGAVTEVNGTVARLAGVPTEEGERLYMLVNLNNGKTVKVRIKSHALFKQGKSVILFKHSPLILGNEVYKFKKYDNNA